MVSDGWSGYARLKEVKHDPGVVGDAPAHLVLPWIHRVFANAKRWALGVYHGLREKHLQAYLDEFVFRFNRRRTPQAAFSRLLGLAVTTGPHRADLRAKRRHCALRPRRRNRSPATRRRSPRCRWYAGWARLPPAGCWRMSVP